MTKLYDGMGNDVTDQYVHKSEILQLGIPKTAVKKTVDANIKSKKSKTKVVKP
tara:strand:- start:2 stop:160 length:159 start_codon:yes stop_codon:yes gene_type:complete